VEARLKRLEARPVAGPRLVRGWRAIEEYTGLDTATLCAYRKREGAPIFRWGRHAVLVPELFGTWLAAREPHQARRRAARRQSAVVQAVDR
jgi:hypothetical protein